MLYDKIFDFACKRFMAVVDSAMKAEKSFKKKEWKEFFREVGKIILFYMILALILAMIILTVRAVYNFFNNQNLLVIIGIGTIFVLAYIIPKLKLSKDLEIPSVGEITKKFHILRKTLFFTIDGVHSEIGVIPPTSEDKLMPIGSTYRLSGLTPIYIYRIRKDKNSSVTADEVQELLQEEFEQKEINMQLPYGNGQFYSYRGRQFSSVLVMSVENNGNFYIIELALASDDACHKWLLKRSKPPEGSREDDEI